MPRRSVAGRLPTAKSNVNRGKRSAKLVSVARDDDRAWAGPYQDTDEREAEPEAEPNRCWQAPDGQVQCEPGKEKRDIGECCLARIPATAAADRHIDERGAEPKRCWQAPDGQVQCEPGKEKREVDGEECLEVDADGHCTSKVTLNAAGLPSE